MLRRVLEAVLLIEGDLDLPSLLNNVIAEARSMTDARYGALGVLNEDRTALEAFLTDGLDPDQERLIGGRPTGLGVLGLLISDARTLRMPRIDQHSEQYGFPPNHPPMTSFLGVPVKVRNEVYGNLYLTDKIGSGEFTDDDQAVVESLAIAAGIAIENARLHRQAQEIAVLEDRDRLARDLHDTVIQHLFAVGLSLQSMASTDIGKDLADRLQLAVAQIDATIIQIRSTIYGLGAVGQTAGMRAQLVALVREVEASTGVVIEVSFEGPVDAAVSEELATQLLAAASEALSNVSRHAHASSASLSVKVVDGRCELCVADDGRGMGHAPLQGSGGLGLANLRHRAESIGGKLDVVSASTGGTTLTWSVPTSGGD
jgi:signal transduction histidine kinase